MKFLLVVHRYPPFAGGSEVYVQAIADELLSRQHKVTVLAGEHKGDQNGVRVTNDANILLADWDLICIHGHGPAVQNFCLQVAKDVPSPILYMIILPSEHQSAIKALNDCNYLGWSTLQDLDHLQKYNVSNKAVRVRHGIKYNENIGKSGFKEKYNITAKRMFLSAGGYWHNKKMIELANLFVKANIPDTVLVTTGYDNRSNLMPVAVPDKVIPLMIENRNEVISAISEADCYIMHSNQEGFGLVLLESMLNRTPWIARNIAGASLLKDFGKTYNTDNELINLMQNFKKEDFNLEQAFKYVLENHMIHNTVDDIEAIARDSINKRSKHKR
jgi:glycosyltransferase involved in cell wall biosynthesis